MRVPDQSTLGNDDAKSLEIWYRFFEETVSNLPQTGSNAPNGAVQANKSCLYIQQSVGSATLWVNEIGSGSKTGWVAK